MKIRIAVAFALGFSAVSVGIAQDSRGTTVVRLYGTKITTSEADAFAKKTLADARVMGARIVVLEKGKVAWSAAYGLRGRDPEQPIDQEPPPGQRRSKKACLPST